MLSDVLIVMVKKYLSKVHLLVYSIDSYNTTLCFQKLCLTL
jgi:hypothetical protein